MGPLFPVGIENLVYMIFYGGNDTTGCTLVILRHNRVLLFIQLE